jgi:hypothetical protein
LTRVQPRGMARSKMNSPSTTPLVVDVVAVVVGPEVATSNDS